MNRLFFLIIINNHNQFPDSCRVLVVIHTSIKDIGKSKYTKLHSLRHPGNVFLKLSYLADLGGQKKLSNKKIYLRKNGRKGRYTLADFFFKVKKMNIEVTGHKNTQFFIKPTNLCFFVFFVFPITTKTLQDSGAWFWWNKKQPKNERQKARVNPRFLN